MRKLSFLNFPPLFAIALIAIATMSCLRSDPRPTLIPLGTPGVIYPANDVEEFPHAFHDWRYDPDLLLLFYKGSWEFVYTDPVLTLYDWRADEEHKLTIPELDGYNSGSYQFSQGPESRFIAYSTNGEVFLLAVENESVERVARGENPSLSPNEHRLAFWREDEIILHDLETFTEEQIYQSEDIYVSDDYSGAGCCITWSPNSRHLTFVIRTHINVNGNWKTRDEIILLDLVTKEAHTAAEEVQLSLPSWSPDSRLIATIQNDMRYGAELHIIDPFNRCVVGRFRTGPLSHAMWFPDGREIAVIYASRQIYIVNVEGAFGDPYTALGCK